jgi:hypothetical protein
MAGKYYSIPHKPGKLKKSHKCIAFCRSCGLEQIAPKVEFLRASRARCVACGGQLDKLDKRVLPHDKTTLELKPDTIPYPVGYSEFETHCFIYQTLRSKGLDVRGMVRTVTGGCIFDLVVFSKSKEPTRIIEVKKSKTGGYGKTKKALEDKERKTQLDKYEAFGIRVDCVAGMKEARVYCEQFVV